MNSEKIVEGLQSIVTNLSQQADGHVLESRILASEGYSVLAEKYLEHATEEREYIVQFVDRILELGGEVKNESKKEMPLCKDPVEWIKQDMKSTIEEGSILLGKVMEDAKDDIITYDLLRNYYKDEVDDMQWAEQQLNLIEKIGLQNWLARQL